MFERQGFHNYTTKINFGDFSKNVFNDKFFDSDCSFAFHSAFLRNTNHKICINWVTLLFHFFSADKKPLYGRKKTLKKRNKMKKKEK